MESGIIETIEKMRSSGKLDTEQSVDLILQLLLGLHKGQQDILEVLVTRENEIEDLDNRMVAVESKVNSMDLKLTSLELAVGTLSESVRIGNNTNEKIQKDLEITKDMAHETKRHTLWYFAKENKAIAMFLLGGIIILINFHQEVYIFLMALLGIHTP